MRTLDLIRNSALPANLMQSAAKGALAVPAAEMIEILVYLATKNSVFGEQARMTLAGWERASSEAAAANPETAKEVLDYLIAPENLRPMLLPALVSNPSVSDEALVTLAAGASRDVAHVLLTSDRVGKSEMVLSALSSNPNLTSIQAATVREKLLPFQPETVPVELQHTEQDIEQDAEHDVEPEEEDDILPEVVEVAAESDTVFDEEINAYLAEHAAELATEGEKPFLPIGGFHDEFESESEEPLSEEAAAASAVATAGSSAPVRPQKKPATKKPQSAPEEGRGSALQKISRLDVKGRIQLAIKGTKEERSILIRDGTKLVALAVLESPKVGDSEVETYATQKNVLEAVLRAIPMKRRFIKHYTVVRNLVFNPRTPLDVSLGLMKNLLVHDLKNLSGNKEVSDTIRKLALKMFRQKASSSGKKSME